MSSYKPFNWSIIVNGSWNRAILTPDGIMTRLFELPAGSAAEVLVPINCIEPPKVKHEGIIVTVSSSRLAVEMDTQDFDSMEKAMKIVRNALEDLPETPVSAAGFNIRYKGAVAESELSQSIQSPLDALSDCEYMITSYGLFRRIRFRKGVINLKATIDENRLLTLELNFNRDSTKQDDLIEWISISKEDVEEETLKITSALEIDIMEDDHVKIDG